MRRRIAARPDPSGRSSRAPREPPQPKRGDSPTTDVRDGKLEEILRELDTAETNMWAFRARTIFQLACMVELRPEETAGHLRRMSSYCEILCRQIQFALEHRELIRLASQLHDIGNVAIPDQLLLQRGELTPSEYEVVKGHAAAGHRLLSGCSSAVMQIAGGIAHTHHERWDGGGYPNGLCERETPLLGRITAIADTFDALTSDRLYHSAMPVSTAAEVMREERGVSLDPQLVDKFLKALPEVEATCRADAGPL